MSLRILQQESEDLALLSPVPAEETLKDQGPTRDQ